MPRIPRMSLPGVALHIVQRGNNRQAVFFDRALVKDGINPDEAKVIRYAARKKGSDPFSEF